LPIPVSSQALIFLYSVIGGMAIAFVYDVFRIKRKTIDTSNFLTCIEDLLYWIIVAIIMFLVVYFGNEGEIRGYIFIGAIIGAVLYILLFSRIIMKIFLVIINIISVILKAVWKVVSCPFKIIFKILWIPIGFFLRQLRKIFRGARRVGKNSAAKAALWKRTFRNIIKKI
jgi:spore cortex biosynthesis protein YabQ